MSTQPLRVPPYGSGKEPVALAPDPATESPALVAWIPLLKVLLACAALYHLALMASTALSSTLSYPFMDQFRFNLRYLTTAFPASVLALENGHRPIIPGVIRVLELDASAGWPVLQIVTTWCSAVLAGGLIVRSVHRDVRLGSLAGCAALCALATLLYSNSNARIFIHPFEGVHFFGVAVFVTAALTLAAGNGARHAIGSWLGAIVLCTAATFTFGPGIASFAAIAVIALLQRRFAMLVAIVLSGTAVLIAYQWALPGANGVRNGVAGASFALTPMLAMARMGAVAAEALRTMGLASELQRGIAVAAGALVTLATLAAIARDWRRRTGLSPIELVGIGLFVFGATANVLIAISRTQYFVQFPDELFADRYLFWTCLAWLGAIVYGLGALRTARPTVRLLASIAVLALSLAMIRSAVEINDWASNVRRMTEMQAIAWRLDLHMDERLGELTDGEVDIAYRSLDEMRRRNLNIFSNAPTLAPGRRVALSEDCPIVPVQMSTVPTDEPGHRGATLVSGVLPSALDARYRSQDLWLASPAGVVVGAAALTSPGDEAPVLGRLGRPRLRGFDGYVHPPVAGELFLVAAERGHVITLAHLVPQS